MDTKERHIRENESAEKRAERAEREGYVDPGFRMDAKERKNNGTRRVNKLWLWLGVLILIFILLWWLWSIGTFEALTGVANG